MHFTDRDVHALTDLSLSIGEGEQVALLGASGSGKTTLLRAALGAVPHAGEIRVGGLDPADRCSIREIRLQSGVLKQGSDLVAGLSGRLNAVMGTAGRWKAREWLQVAVSGCPSTYTARLNELALAHGVADCLDARVSQLSGGQRQRLALVRALLPDPGLILADEPTSGLDTASAERAVEGLRATDTTLVVATHDLGVARAFPRVVALRHGRVVHDGPELDPVAQSLVYG